MVQRERVENSILILACVLLAGVISMAIGFFYHSSLMVHIGIPLTLITSLLISIQNMIKQSKIKRTIH